MKRSVSNPARRYEEFVFRVRRPSASYIFSLQYDRRADDPYDESQSVSFDVECLYPDRCKGRVAEAWFHADVELTAGSERRRQSRNRPRAVGSIIVGKDRFEVSGFLPTIACWQIGLAMAAGTITSMLTNGEWPTRGHGYLNSISFHGPDFDPIEYIG